MGQRTADIVERLLEDEGTRTSYEVGRSFTMRFDNQIYDVNFTLKMTKRA